MEFQKYSDFEGVFYRSGMTDFKLQVDIIHHKEKYVSFDIIAADRSGRCCNVEVTTNRSKDIAQQLEKHAGVTPADIMEQVGFTVSSSPDVVSCANFDHDVGFCCISIEGRGRSVCNTQMLGNEVLARNLESIKDHCGYPVSTKFTLVPEPNEYELRSGLCDILYHMSFGGSAFEIREIVDMGLDFLSDYYGFDGKHDLMKRVGRAMEDLCDAMPYAFRRDGSLYRAIGIDDMGRKKSTYSNDLRVWMESSCRKQKSLDEFPGA